MENEGKKNNVFIKTLLKVLAIFIGFELISNIVVSIIGGTIWDIIKNGKYTIYFVSEAAVVLFSIILLIAFKKVSILKKWRLKFLDAIKLGVPLLVISVLMFVGNSSVVMDGNANLANFFSLVIFTFFIGFFEEVFYRGIIEGELIDNYSRTRKEAITSIVISALIFGGIHFGNFFMGQDLVTTIMQVIQTSAIGILLGSVYYISRNIWAVIFLHGFYDFSVMLGDINLIKDCNYVDNLPLKITLILLVVSLLISTIYILYSSILLCKSKVAVVLNEEVSEEQVINDKKSNKLFVRLIIGCLVLFFVVNMASSYILKINSNKYYKCYTYEEITFDKMETHYYSYDDFNINVSGFNYFVYAKDNKAYIKNQNNVITDLGYDDVVRLIVVDNSILVITSDGNNFVSYYSDYFNKVNNGICNINDLKDSFKKYDISTVLAVGYLKDVYNNIKYPMIKSINNDILIIKDNSVFVVKEK